MRGGEDGLIGSRDGYRHPSRDRRGLADRVGQAHRRPRADRARRRPRRGARAGRARRRARAVAGVGRPGQPGRLAHGHREASRDRPLAPQQAARAQARGARPRARGRAGDGRAGSRRRARRRRRRRPAAPGLHGLPSGALDRGARRAHAAPARRPDDRRDRARVPRPRADRSRSASSAPSGRSPKRRSPSRFRAAPSSRARLSSVLEVIYLIFNEGYSATAGDDWMRPALCEDALRLGRILAELAPSEPEVHGLVALMEIQASRARARVGPVGRAGPAARSEPRALGPAAHPPRPRRARSRRARWAARRAVRAAGRDRRLPRARAHRRRRPTGRASPRSTPSSRASTPSPVVELNRAVAVAMAFGPEAGLDLVETLVGADTTQLSSVCCSGGRSGGWPTSAG